MSGENKRKQLVVAFRNTTDAVCCDKLCKAKAVEGRLAPMPRLLSSSCGLCWRGEPELKETVEALLREADIWPVEIRLLML